eukprot:TRINITY_DN15932_c0_g1_i1.p1 TRINITY_DN15932_c0_g1~~TRINITY_DN15932_c0_g1_i1.p1  ORF type:complete len:225 (-),score=36.44 TRINITY_DN15932_c0_g1_i1:42-716(-)
MEYVPLPEEAKKLWASADCVCFDVDSTVVTEEAINVLAEICGCGDEIAAYTHRAMNGETEFEDALRERLAIIQPTTKQLRDCSELHPLILSPYITDLFSSLRQRNVDIFLISGGFVQLIEPLLETLQVPKDHVYANVLEFTSEGAYSGFDAKQPTSRTGGKAVALNTIIEKYGHKRIVMIGDGVTDLEAKPPAFMFIGYGGVTIREKVRLGADYFITDFRSLLC